MDILRSLRMCSLMCKQLWCKLGDSTASDAVCLPDFYKKKKGNSKGKVQTPHNTEVLKKHLKRPTLSTSSVRRYESKFLFNSKVCIKSVYGLFVPMFTFYWCQILIP